MKTLELEKYGVSEISTKESLCFDGGGQINSSISPWGALAAIAGFVIDQWDDIKKGWNDAEAGKEYNYSSK